MGTLWPKNWKKLSFLLVTVPFLHIESSVIPPLKAFYEGLHFFFLHWWAMSNIWGHYHMHSKWDRIISALVTWIKNISRVSEAKRGRYELIQVTCAEIILSHFEMHMMIFFSHLSLFNRWNILKIWENLSKWNMDVAPLICARLTFSPRRLRASR